MRQALAVDCVAATGWYDHQPGYWIKGDPMLPVLRLRARVGTAGGAGLRGHACDLGPRRCQTSANRHLNAQTQGSI